MSKHFKSDGVTYSKIPYTTKEIVRSKWAQQHIAKISAAVARATALAAARSEPAWSPAGDEIIVEDVGTGLAQLSYRDLGATYVEFRVHPLCPERAVSLMKEELAKAIGLEFSTTPEVSNDGERTILAWGFSSTKIWD